MFKFRLWVSTGITLAGILLLLTLPMRESAWWLLAVLAGHMVLSLTITCGMHRYYSHHTFKLSKLQERVLSVFSVLAVQGSPITWAAVHVAHHRYVDSPLDPHPGAGRWATMFVQKEAGSTMNKNMRPPKSLARDPWHAVIHRNYVLFLGAWLLAMYLVSPELLLNVYLPAAATVQLVTAMVLAISHRGGEPRTDAWLEFVLPAGGEWSHKRHHKYPGFAKHGKFDLGYLVIKMIAKPGSVR
jgi:stearoyl-CoA desaturase (Delta-9 desaturase)